MKWLLAVSLPFFVIDQVTKELVLRYVPLDVTIPVIPGFFNIIQAHNTGAAFSMFRDNNYFFVGLASTALLVLVFLFWKGKFAYLTTKWAGALLVAGIAGNLLDRLRHGFVVDFLDVILPWYGHWPTFNVADSCICVAAGLFVIASFREERAQKKAKAEAR